MHIPQTLIAAHPARFFLITCVCVICVCIEKLDMGMYNQSFYSCINLDYSKYTGLVFSNEILDAIILSDSHASIFFNSCLICG